MAATVQTPDLGVGPVGDQFLQFRCVEEMLADIGAVLGLEGLVFAIDAFHHAFLQDAFLVAGKERIPVGAPDQLDDVPAGTTEFRFQFLDDLAVAAHRAVEALQVAVDDEDQVVQFFAAGHADGAERFDFIGLAVAEEGPDLAAACFFRIDQVTRRQVLHEAGLIDRLNRAEAHGDRGELPEVRHQPGVRVGGNAFAAGLLAEVVQLFLRQAAEHEGARIDAGYRVALEEDQVAVVFFGGGVPEMGQADVVEDGSGGEGGDVAADIGVLVGTDHHGHGVPAHVVVNLDLDVGIARILGLLVDRDGVDVLGVGRVRQINAFFAGLGNQALDQVVGALRAFVVDDAVERLHPFLGFLCVGVERQVLWLIGHDMSPTLVFDYVVPDRSDNFNALRAVVQRAFVMDAAVVL